MSNLTYGIGGSVEAERPRVDSVPARDETEVWSVQCKCHGSDNPVGPSVVRELVGTMASMAWEPGQTARGMIVTSSRFTPEAQRLAMQHGINVVDGTALNNIGTAVNRRPGQPSQSRGKRTVG